MKAPTDAIQLADAKRCACGHAALAAALGKNVLDVLPLFEQQGPGLWVNERRMKTAIEASGHFWNLEGLPWPVQPAVVWIQGLGSWMEKGVPVGARNARSHWIATARNEQGRQMVYDINHGDWLPLAFWKTTTLRPLLEHWKAADWTCRTTLSITSRS